MGAIAIVGLLLAGAAVGATSIGGVLVVPVLTAWTSTSLGGAIAASSFAFAFTGAAAFAWPVDRGRAQSSARATTASPDVAASRAAADARAMNAAPVEGVPAVSAGSVAAEAPAAATMTTGAVAPAAVVTPAELGGWPLHGCALLGAALGAATLGWLPAGGIRVGLGLLAVASGLHGLWRLRVASGAHAGSEPGAAELGPTRLAAIGFGVGCASAWSGTGGPVLLLPLLALFGWRTDRAVAAAQRIQLPVALAATAVHLGAGRLDLRLGLVVGALVLAGWVAGRWLGGRMTTRRLAQAVAVAMVGVGLWYLRPT